MLKEKMWKWLIILCLVAGYTQASENQLIDNQSTVVQISTVSALLKGIYDGETTFGQLKTFGDFGFGTVNGLDGEMAGFDGQFYQIKGDGSVHLLSDSQKTPYATVHFFKADKIVVLEKTLQSYTDFQNYLDQHLPSRNRPYALKVTGTFDYLKTRSVHKQQKPYPPVIKVTASQSIFEFKSLTGVAVGYWFPEYMDKLNVPGYHLHFVSKDKQHGGGHVLDCRLSKVTIAIDFIDNIHILIPQDEDFQNADLSTYSREDLEKAETDHH